MNNEMAASCNLESNEWEIQMGKMNVGNISITINFTALQNRIFDIKFLDIIFMLIMY